MGLFDRLRRERKPPPPGPGALDLERPDLSGVILAPHCSAIVVGEGTVDDHVPGQRPGGGTTLREVRPDASMNLGEGPAASLDALLEASSRRCSCAGVSADLRAGDSRRCGDTWISWDPSIRPAEVST